MPLKTNSELMPMGREEQDHVIMFSHMKTLFTLDVLGFKNVVVMFLAWRI
jgi:hypothetical protein